MNKNGKTLIFIGLFAIFMLVAIISYNYLTERYKAKNPLTTERTAEVTPTSSPEASDSETENEPLEAPDFVAYDAMENEVKLSDYKGIPVVLNFWSSWCPPCQAEMPDFNKVSEEFSKDELVFLMVDMVDGQRETVESGKKYIEEKQYTFTVLYDKDQDAAATYGVRSIPSTIFIDKDGYVQAGVEGMIDEETLRQGIDMILPN